MKKTLILSIVILLVLPLASCGSGTSLEVQPQSSKTPEETVVTFEGYSTDTSTPALPSTDDPTSEKTETIIPVTTETEVTVPTTESPTAPTTEPTTEKTETPVQKDRWLLHETADAGLDYQNKLIFLGDSTTAGMIAYKVLPGGENTKQVWRGAVGNTITFLYLEDVEILYPDTNESLTIVEAARKAQPEYLVITLGVTGGVSQNLEKDKFLTLYKWLLDNILKVSPDTSIIVQSIFPVNKEIWDDYKRITNEKIEMTNVWIKEMVKDYNDSGKNIFYADTYPVLLDEEGYMKKEYGNGDGLHISAEGYAVILNYLRTHALTLQ